jgi:hypothetical protein
MQRLLLPDGGQELLCCKNSARSCPGSVKASAASFVVSVIVTGPGEGIFRTWDVSAR